MRLDTFFGGLLLSLNAKGSSQARLMTSQGQRSACRLALASPIVKKTNLDFLGKVC